jgi:hypothetical protein
VVEEAVGGKVAPQFSEVWELEVRVWTIHKSSLTAPEPESINCHYINKKERKTEKERRTQKKKKKKKRKRKEN